MEYQVPYQSRCVASDICSLQELPMMDEYFCEKFDEHWPCLCVTRRREQPQCSDIPSPFRVKTTYRLPSTLDIDHGTGNLYHNADVVEWMQKELLARGPFPAAFHVYEDFFAFDFAAGGVYRCKTR